MKTKRTNRLLAAFISLCMVVGMLPATAFAEGQTANGLCEHHLEHTAECGYMEGQPCAHEHSEDCYTDKLTCGYDEEAETTATDSGAEHTHTQKCYALDCPHERGEHDATCGYAEAQPCRYTCELCEKKNDESEPKPGEEAVQTACTLTEGCTLPDGHEGECETELSPVDGVRVKTITSWTFVGDDNLNEGELPLTSVSVERQADFDTVVSMLPTGISAEIEGETEPVQVDITGWRCPEYVQDADDNWPVTGEYVFTAALQEGYACDPLPTVKALIGGAELYASPATVGDFQITGDASGYTFNDTELVIHDGATLTIQNTDSNTSTPHRIKVEENAKVNITLAGVNIDENSKNKYAFDMTGATVKLTLAKGSVNSLKGNGTGLRVPHGATLIIQGDGELKAESKLNTGIGGNIDGSDGGNVTIQGNTKVTAIGTLGAGIGGGRSDGKGGNGGNGGRVSIQGNAEVIATSRDGAGIGGGSGGSDGKGGSGGEVIIKDNARVTATSTDGAGIGGGEGGNGMVGGSGGEVIIKGSAQVSATSNKGAGMGGGMGGVGGGVGGGGGTVTLSGAGVIVITNGNYDVGGGIGEGGEGEGGSLSVKDGATLEMQRNDTNVTSPTYQNCTIIGENKNSVEYGGSGRPMASPTLSLEVSPAGSLTLPGDVTLTATLSGADGGNSGRTITFTGSGNHPTTTNDSGVATYTFTAPSPGTYTFGASFAGDGDNKPADATPINNYVVSRTQTTLTIIGLDSTYTYGDEPFDLFTSGGSDSGAVDFLSSEPSIASVTGSTVTIQKAGTFTITATKAEDDNYAETTVTSGTVTVNPATPDVSLTATGGANINDPVVLAATVSKAGAGMTPTGTVTFKEGDTILAENVVLDGSGKATCTVSNPAAGNHTYTAAYSGQSGYYNSASADRTVGVGLADQTGFAITDPGEKTYGEGEFTLTATGGQITGGVSFSVPDGNGVLAVAADGKVTITGAGKVTVTAMKDGDSTYNPATAILEITVKPRDISNVTVNVTGSRVYTGSQLQPVFEAKDGSTAITTGDYTNEYGPNVDTGADTGSIKLTGRRNYTGTKTVTFDIEKRPLDGAAITLEFVTQTHTNREIKPAVTSVVVDGITVPAAEFDVGYANNTAVGTATVTVTARADGNFSGTASTTFEITKSNSSSGGGGGGGSSSSSDSTVTAPKDSYTSTGTQIGQSVSRSDLQSLANAGKSLTIQGGTAAMTFDPAALKAILAEVPATAGNITFAAVQADIRAFPDAAALIGTRPAYSFTISYKDSNGSAIPVNVNFPAGSASVSLNDSPAEGEAAGSLFMVYVDGKGAVTWLDKSSYTSGKVLADVPHFSVYGVAYKAPVPIFTDITNHWAKADMEFVAARGLLSGTGEKVFSPDAAMTRGMFVTALGRLAGVAPASYQTRSFTDVKADAYYAAYVEWAAQKNIVKGTGEGLFSPDAPVTREQMAVMMTNYAGQMGYSIPTPLAAVTFADNADISAWAAKEVAAMQRAGIVRDKDGNRFDPQGNATRAEASAVLRRFVEIVIDPVTAQGWGKNDSGQWLYYKDGKILTGWKQIGGKWYYFDKNGIMAVNPIAP